MASSSTAMSHPDAFMKKSEVPDSGRDWISVSPGVEFQPAEDIDTQSGAVHRVLEEYNSKEGNNRRKSPYDMQFVDGTETYYDDYAQAWRLLGFYIDCNAPAFNGNECGGNSGDNNDDANQYDEYGNYQLPCQRYLMWAAYVDPHYSGGQIGEYQFYNRHKQNWDTTSCIAKNGRCAKMDCHLKDTKFKLLGFFKEPNYHEWMEQLFKHEGVCIWNDAEYEYMQEDRELWPCQCTNTFATDENGNYLYYDTKPMPKGRIGLGLYTDSRCSQDYSHSKKRLEEVLETYVSSYNYQKNQKNEDDDSNYFRSNVYNLTVHKTIEKWNNAFDAFKVCQPCKAYNLGYNPNTNGYRQGGWYDDDGYGNYNAFTCNDDADYTNVNQCMKFKTKTEMISADFRDMMLAHRQGNIVEIEMLGVTYGHGGYRPVSLGSVLFLVASSMILFIGAFMHRDARKGEGASFVSIRMKVTSVIKGFSKRTQKVGEKTAECVEKERGLM